MNNTDQLTKLLRSLVKILSAVQRKYESVSVGQETGDNQKQDSVRSQPIEFRSDLPLPVAVREYYESEQRERRTLWTRRIKPGLEIFGIAVAFALAIFTYLTLDQVRQQTPKVGSAAEAAQGQLKVMQAGQRPWAGLGGQVQLSSEPAFKLMFAPVPSSTVPPPVLPPSAFAGPPNRVNLTLEVVVTVRNFGASPAFDVNGMMMTYIPPPANTITRPDKTRMLCPVGLTVQHLGEVIFPSPNSEYIQGFSQQTSVDLKQHSEIGRVWLLGCIVYHDHDQGLHHTWFWLRSTHPDNAQWITDSRVFRHMPILGFESWGEEAD
ncbi:MAG: hypothetical protein WCB12_13190 [Bryobacteraceae bacterium]